MLTVSDLYCGMGGKRDTGVHVCVRIEKDKLEFWNLTTAQCIVGKKLDENRFELFIMQ